MSHKVVQCPGCSVKLKFKPRGERTTVNCPKCGQKIAFRSQEPPPVEEELLEVEPEPAKPAPKPPPRPGQSSRRPSGPPKRRPQPVPGELADTKDDIYDYFGVEDEPEPPRRESSQTRPKSAEPLQRRERKRAPDSRSSSIGLTLLMVLVPLGLLGGGAWLAYRLVAGPGPEVAENDADAGIPVTDLAPNEPADNRSAKASPANVNPVQPRPNPNPPPIARNEPPRAGNVAVQPGGLRYQWKPGQQHVYSVSIQAGDDRSGQTITGNCTYTVDGIGMAGADSGRASGTGFVISADGYVATCAHVVEGANRIDVTIGGRTYRGRVIASKKHLDLALVKINASGLPVSQLGDSDRVQLAESVRAFGFPLSSMLGTSIKSAAGEVSGITMHPKHGKQIQTDAPINPGNSGGPLVNDSGQVVGVASSKIAARFASSVGFAVPVNELKKMIRDQGVAVPGAGSGQKLSGTALAKKVTPSVCYIEVRGALGEQVYNVRYSASYSQHQRYDPRNFRIRPSFPSHQSPRGTIKVDDSGQVHEVQGDDNLPFVLGSIAQLCLEEIDTDGDKSWTRESESTVSIMKKAERDPFGGMFPRGFGPRFGPRFGSPLDPFGRNQKPKEQPVDTIPATESTKYRIAGVNGNRITVSKSYDFTTTRNAARPYLSVKGRGTFVFDTDLGMPVTMTYTATLAKNDDDGRTEIPLKVNYQRKDAETLRKEREAAKARMAEIKKEREEQQRINEEKRTIPNPANVDTAIAAVKAKSMSHQAGNPLKELAGLAIVPEKRKEVLELARQHVKHDSSFVSGPASLVIVRWASDEDLGLLKDIALERDVFNRDARKAAFTRLFELEAKEIYPRLIEELDDNSFRYELKKLLIAAGRKMEQPILDNYANLRESSARRECIEILGKIGTKASKPFLQELFGDRRLRSYAGRAMDEIQKRE